jgi:hypothetical protein
MYAFARTPTAKRADRAIGDSQRRKAAAPAETMAAANPWRSPESTVRSTSSPWILRCSITGITWGISLRKTQNFVTFNDRQAFPHKRKDNLIEESVTI